MDSTTPSSSSSSTNPPKPDLTNSGYDPNASWSNIFNAFVGRMTRVGEDEFREATYIKNSIPDQKNCEEWRDWCFSYSPTVIFLRKEINVLNGDMNKSNVLCRRCPARRDENGRLHQQGGGFNPDAGILICSNQIRDRKHLEDTLAHELVHAWDQLRWKVDWDDLRHAACSEIRASSLSGECRFTREFFTRGQRTVTQQHQACVRRRAVASLMQRPNCKDDVQAVKVVNEVWDSCFADTRPFDDIYR